MQDLRTGASHIDVLCAEKRACPGVVEERASTAVANNHRIGERGGHIRCRSQAARVDARCRAGVTHQPAVLVLPHHTCQFEREHRAEPAQIHRQVQCRPAGAHRNVPDEGEPLLVRVGVDDLGQVHDD